MTENQKILKIAELRKAIKQHKQEELEYIIAELYKMIPKERKIDNDVSELILHPSKTKAKPRKAGPKLRPFSEVEAEVERFIENAYDGYYLVPNRVVKKSDRPKWRFVVKRLYKELVNYAKNEELREVSAGNLQNLYEVLTYSCGYTLFTAYDTFESIGISQPEFFNTILFTKEKYQEKKDFISNAIKLINDNFVNRYTLYSDLIDIFLNYLTIPDLNYQAIKIADEMRKKVKDIKGNGYGSDEYEKKEKMNHLTELVFKCYANLFEYDNAIDYFNKYYVNTFQPNDEVKLYVLVSLLFQRGEKELIVREVSAAQQQGVIPRDRLLEIKRHIEETGELPGYL